MRDDHKHYRLIIQPSPLKVGKQIVSIMLIFLLLTTLFLPILAHSETKEKHDFIIEFSSPCFIQQILCTSIYKKQSNPYLFSSFSEIRKNISLFQETAIQQMKNKIDLDLDSIQVEYYQLLFNGLRLSSISTSVANKIETLPFVNRVTLDTLLYHNSELTNSASSDNPSVIRSSINPDITQFSGKNVSIAFFDTGIDYTHPALSLNYKGGFDFVNNDFDPYDDHGHGTHVTGITAAQIVSNHSNQTMKGVAPNASVYAYKVLDQQGEGYTSWFLSAFERAMDPNKDGNISDQVDVISISAGNPHGSTTDPLSMAAKNAVRAGIIVLAAAGNNGPAMNTIHSPAIAPEVIAVGATIDNNMIASFSSRGNCNESTIKPNVVASGYEILSTWPGNQYKRLSGTSMSTPYVTGIVACLLEYNSSLNPAEVQKILHAQSQPLTGTVWEEGYGFIQASTKFQIKKPIPVNSTVIQQSYADNLYINLSFQKSVPTPSYSIHIYSIEHCYTIRSEKNNKPVNTNQLTLIVPLTEITSGYHILTIELATQHSFFRMKKIIFLENMNHSEVYLPDCVFVGETFSASLNTLTYETPALFVFIIPLRSIQLRVGTTCSFTVPQFTSIRKEGVNATMFIIPLKLPFTWFKESLIILTDSSC